MKVLIVFVAVIQAEVITVPLLKTGRTACRPWCTKEDSSEGEVKEETKKREEEIREDTEKREEEIREDTEKREEEIREDTEKREEEIREDVAQTEVEMEERRITGTEDDKYPVWECERMFGEKSFSEYRRCIKKIMGGAAQHNFVGKSGFIVEEDL
ncbi:hypothetical protein ACHWQZ_G017961 [Mnemiopsis leidyi]